MAAVLGNIKVGLKKTSVSTTVPDHPQAKLMFYFDCMCVVLDLDNSSTNLRALRDYKNYNRLPFSQVDELLVLCVLLSPDVLLNKCIFYNEEMCGNSTNAFYELSAMASHMLVTESVLIGGQRRSVQKIMTFKESYLRRNYLEPMTYYSQRLRRIADSGTSRLGGAPRRAVTNTPHNRQYSSSSGGDGCCCVIL